MTNLAIRGPKVIRIHERVEKEFKSIDTFTIEKIVELLELIAQGERLSLPVSRPMPAVANGVHELRIKGGEGSYRVFYFVNLVEAVLVFHLFKKKTQKTPRHEIEVAKKRLREMI
jgi:phage-related protein